LKRRMITLCIATLLLVIAIFVAKNYLTDYFPPWSGIPRYERELIRNQTSLNDLSGIPGFEAKYRAFLNRARTPEERHDRILALGFLSGRSYETISLLEGEFESPDLDARFGALYAITLLEYSPQWFFEPPNLDEPRMIRAIGKVLDDNDEIIRKAGFKAIFRIAPEYPEIVVPMLIGGLGDQLPEIRKGASAALGWYGGEAVEAMPALAKLLEDVDPEVRSAARRAMSRINSDRGDVADQEST